MGTFPTKSVNDLFNFDANPVISYKMDLDSYPPFPKT